ncbi:MAG: hypothetical protein GX962_11215 [Epulopiscium sp.]|nr:hypothetical protein [Candidatus Epulonipiscium sp.]
MKKQLVFFLFILFLFWTPTVLLASPISMQDDKINDSVTVEDALGYVEDVEEEKLLDLGLIQIKKGLSKKEEPTFAQQRNIAIEGKEGTSIIIFVYSTNDQGDINLTFESVRQAIGASGIYNESISFDTIGENYVLIYAEKGEQKVARLFQINRKKQETKIELQSKRYDILKLIP